MLYTLNGSWRILPEGDFLLKTSSGTLENSNNTTTSAIFP